MTAMPALTEAAAPPAKPASASSDMPRHEAAVAPLPPLSGPAKEPDKTEARRAPVEEILAVQPPAAGPAKKPAPAVERLRLELPGAAIGSDETVRLLIPRWSIIDRSAP